MEESNFRLPQQEWVSLRQLLGEALDVPPSARGAWLAALPVEHAAHSPRLRALLSHADAAIGQDHLLQTLPKFETGDFAALSPDADRSGELVGPYRLLRQLGEGGMACVWLAERVDWPGQRLVALKLPHGAWRRAGLVERFTRERAILATLEHPHIARLYDAGVTPESQPYLALEYVDGERIDCWCDAHAAGVSDRLTLFLQVCEAVAHAHARLIVHREIKPLTRESGRALTPETRRPSRSRAKPSAPPPTPIRWACCCICCWRGVTPMRWNRARSRRARRRRWRPIP